MILFLPLESIGDDISFSPADEIARAVESPSGRDDPPAE